jgi:hypothetical protein
VLKKICRRHGLKRWPNRRLKSIDKQLAMLLAVLEEEGAEGDQETRREIEDQVDMLRSERAKLCCEQQ